MINVTIRKHPDDSDMIELLGKTSTGKTIVWGVIHSDFVYEDEDLRSRIKKDEEVEVVLTRHIYTGGGG